MLEYHFRRKLICSSPLTTGDEIIRCSRERTYAKMQPEMGTVLSLSWHIVSLEGCAHAKYCKIQFQSWNLRSNKVHYRVHCAPYDWQVTAELKLVSHSPQSTFPFEKWKVLFTPSAKMALFHSLWYWKLKSTFSPFVSACCQSLSFLPLAMIFGVSPSFRYSGCECGWRVRSYTNMYINLTIHIHISIFFMSAYKLFRPLWHDRVCYSGLRTNTFRNPRCYNDFRVLRCCIL